MNIKDKLCLYGGILLGHNGVSVANRFRLSKIVMKNDVDNLYIGARIDNLSNDDFENGEVVRCWLKDMLIYLPGRADATIIKHISGEEEFFDLLDDNKLCTYIDRSTNDAKYGCCNLVPMCYDSVMEDARYIKMKKKEKKNDTKTKRL